MFRTHFVTDDDYEEDTMKNKKFIALLAMTVALSGVMTACSFGGGKEDSVVVESTPTPTPAKKAKGYTDCCSRRTEYNLYIQG
mgnify:CR=1 FL=1